MEYKFLEFKDTPPLIVPSHVIVAPEAQAAPLFPEDVVQLMARVTGEGTVLDFIAENPELLLKSPADYIGDNIKHLAPKKLADEGLVHINQVLQNGRAQTIIYRIPQPDNEFIYEIKIIASGPDEVFIQVQDVTRKRKEKKELLWLNRALLSYQGASAALSTSLDEEYIKNTALWEITSLLNVPGCVVSEWDPENDTLLPMESYPQKEWSRAYPENRAYSLSVYPLTKLVLQEKTPRQITVGKSGKELPEQEYMNKANISTLLMIPIIYQSRVMGLLEIIEQQPRTFTDQEIILAQLLINETSKAIGNARQHKQLERQLQEVTALNEINLAVTSTLNPQERLDIITNKILDLVDAAAVSVALLKSDKEHIHYVSASGEAAAFIQTKQLKLGQGIVSWVIQQNQPALLPDVKNDPRHYGRFDKESGFETQSILCIPLRVKDHVIGAISALNKLKGQFNKDDLRLLTTLAASVAISIENARLFQNTQREIVKRRQIEAALEQERSQLSQRVAERTLELHRQYQRQKALAAIEPAISHPHELQSVLQQIVNAAETAVSASGGVSIVLWDEEEGFYVAASSSKARSFNKAGQKWQNEETSYEIMKNQRPMITSNIQVASPKTNEWRRKSGLSNYVGIPVIGQGKSLGIIYALCQKTRTFTQEEIDFLTALANRAGVAIVNVQLYEILQKTNEELATAARMKDEFLASMSHELRTPLNAILGISEGLQEQYYGPLNDKQIRSLEIVEESGRHLLALINDILDVSRIESGQLTLEIEPLQVQPVCEASLQFIKQAAAKKQISITLSVDDQIPVINADVRRLKQILINLLSNAVKFTPEGGSVGLKVTHDSAQEMVCMTVWDTGIGIAEEDMSRLFQPFVQLDSSLSRHYAGTGLGLLLVKRMAEQHSGHVSVESQLGQGSRFTVSLPCCQNDQEDYVQDWPFAKPAPGITENDVTLAAANSEITILLVDDDKFNVEIFSHYLEMEEYRVLFAYNGKDAIKLCTQEKPDLIIMDIQMPGMNGLEVIRRIRVLPDFTAVPIIALTALVMDGDRENCLEAGADMYLSKPAPLQKLGQAIRACLVSGQQ